MKVLDLFSGIGGFSLGLERTGGFDTVAFCEIDKKARQVLRKHWQTVPIFDDITNLRGDQIGTVDVICGGFPCQDISFAGRGAGLAGERSGLWWQFHRLIKEIKPKYVIAENVSALRSRGLDEVLRSLAEIGYDAEWHCIPASAVGAHHRRDRIWIIAYPHDSGSRASEHGANQDGQKTEQERNHQSFNRIGGLREDVPHADSTGLQGGEEAGDTSRLWSHLNQQFARCRESGGRWFTESTVCRVANGVSGRVDRLKQLGNAVVPQIPELIGNAILSYEAQS